MDYLSLIGRSGVLFSSDILGNEKTLRDIIRQNRFLIIGGSGSIGQAIAREVFRRDPQVLHVVDLSENNMVEFVRDIRSTVGYGSGDFRTFSLDCGSVEFEALMTAEGFWNENVDGSNIKESVKYYKYAIQNPPKGRYSVKIQHGMRDEFLGEIVSIGTRIEKHEN